MAKINTIIVGGKNTKKTELKNILLYYEKNVKNANKYMANNKNNEFLETTNTFDSSIIVQKDFSEKEPNLIGEISTTILNKIDIGDNNDKIHSVLYCIGNSANIENDKQNIMTLKISGVDVTPVITNSTDGADADRITDILLESELIDNPDDVYTIDFNAIPNLQLKSAEKIYNRMYIAKDVSLKNYQNIVKINKEMERQFNQFKRTLPMNIVVVGNKGVGKSELINSVLGKPSAEVGLSAIGTKTQKISPYTKDNLTIYDTPGVITQESIKNVVTHINSLGNSSLNSIWYCINPNALINSDEDDDEIIKSKISNEVENIAKIKDETNCLMSIVLTKAIDNENLKTVRTLLPQYLDDLNIPVIDVIAKAIKKNEPKNVQQLENDTVMRLISSPKGQLNMKAQKDIEEKELEVSKGDIKKGAVIDTSDSEEAESPSSSENDFNYQSQIRNIFICGNEKENNFQTQIGNIASELFNRHNIKNRLDVAWQIATTDIAEKMKHYNIVLMGQTGVGKSTLINAVLGDNKAKAQTGLPCTQELSAYEGNASMPIRLWDTKGLELEQPDKQISDVKKLVDESNKSQDPDKYIHAIWYCPNMPRIQPLEITAIKELTKMYEGKDGLPVILVLTKAADKKEYEDYSQSLKEQGITNQIIPVLSKDYAGTKAFGKDELIKKTLNIVPNSAINAAITTSKASINSQLKNINEKSQKIISRNLSKTGHSISTLINTQQDIIQEISGLYMSDFFVKNIANSSKFKRDKQYFNNIDTSILKISTEDICGKSRLQKLYKEYKGLSTGKKIALGVSSVAGCGLCAFLGPIVAGIGAAGIGANVACFTASAAITAVNTTVGSCSNSKVASLLLTPSFHILNPGYMLVNSGANLENIQISRVGNAYINSMESLIHTSFDRIINSKNAMALMREKLEIAKESMSKGLNISKKDNDAIDKLSLEEFNNEFTPRVKHHTIKQTRNTNDYTGFENSLDILD